jgi:hypothetical protein
MEITREMFETLVEKHPSGCWLWKFGRTTAGYGFKRINKKFYYAHRLSWELKNGPIPKGLFVCHKCDNPPCANPDHLFVGTCKENVWDALKKGRLHKQAETFRRLWRDSVFKRGENNSGHKLTNEQVIEMRRLHSEEKWGYKRLHRHFKISFGVAQRIINRKSWNHI